jgi:hypothetical protein
MPFSSYFYLIVAAVKAVAHAKALDNGIGVLDDFPLYDILGNDGFQSSPEVCRTFLVQ